MTVRNRSRILTVRRQLSFSIASVKHKPAQKTSKLPWWGRSQGEQVKPSYTIVR